MLKRKLKLFLVSLQYTFYCLLHFLHLKSSDKLKKHQKRRNALRDQIQAINSLPARTKAYFEHKKPKNTKVVYTCLVGDYDNFIDYLSLNPEYDYICFTDNQKLLARSQKSAWQIRELEYKGNNNTLSGRYHKLHPHIILANYSESLYIDANVWIKSNKLYEIIAKLSKSEIFLSIPKHPKRDCIYSEMQVCLDFKLENQKNIDKLKDFYIHENFPKNNGLVETNIIYRKHLSQKCITIMQDWWFMLTNYSKRDQLSLFYVLYRHNLSMDYLNIQHRDDFDNFQVLGHKK